jgi:hypothetical protein
MATKRFNKINLLLTVFLETPSSRLAIVRHQPISGAVGPTPRDLVAEHSAGR